MFRSTLVAAVVAAASGALQTAAQVKTVVDGGKMLSCVYTSCTTPPVCAPVTMPAADTITLADGKTYTISTADPVATDCDGTAASTLKVSIDVTGTAWKANVACQDGNGTTAAGGALLSATELKALEGAACAADALKVGVVAAAAKVSTLIDRSKIETVAKDLYHCKATACPAADNYDDASCVAVTSSNANKSMEYTAKGDTAKSTLKVVDYPEEEKCLAAASAEAFASVTVASDKVTKVSVKKCTGTTLGTATEYALTCPTTGTSREWFVYKPATSTGSGDAEDDDEDNSVVLGAAVALAAAAFTTTF